jgi:hypothetical protein
MAPPASPADVAAGLGEIAVNQLARVRRDPALIDAVYEAVMDILLAHGRLVSLNGRQDSMTPALAAMRR